MILRGPHKEIGNWTGFIRTPDNGYRRGEEREVLIPSP